MQEEFRRLGLNGSFKGTNTLKELVSGSKELSDLSDREIEDVLEAWESRRYIPIGKLQMAISSKPGHVEGETDAEYNHRHVEKIVEILKGFISTPCA